MTKKQQSSQQPQTQQPEKLTPCQQVQQLRAQRDRLLIAIGRIEGQIELLEFQCQEKEQ